MRSPGVSGSAGVGTAGSPGHALQNQRLVDQQHARRDVVTKEQALQRK